MRDHRVLRGSVARAASPFSLGGSKIYGINLVKALQERYGFTGVPDRIEGFNLEANLRLSQGYFDGTVFDAELMAVGVRVIAASDTNVCEKIADDIIYWAKDSAGVAAEIGELRVYDSVIEFHSDLKLSKLFNILGNIGGKIGDLVGGYGGPGDAYEGIGINLLPNVEEKGPSLFRIEHRAGHPLTEGVFFSMAPLSTEDHLRVLREIEEILA